MTDECPSGAHLLHAVALDTDAAVVARLSPELQVLPDAHSPLGCANRDRSRLTSCGSQLSLRLQVVLSSELFDEIELRLQEIDVLFF